MIEQTILMVNDSLEMITDEDLNKEYPIVVFDQACTCEFILIHLATHLSYHLWKGQYQGMDMVFVKGKIIDLIPNQLLVYTVFDPNSCIPDIPENYLHVTYQLIRKNNLTSLTVTQGDYNKVAEGERRYQESWNDGQGWNPILEKIKNICEAD